MSIERIGGRKFKVEKVDTDEIKKWEKSMSTPSADLLSQKKEEERKKYEEEVKKNSEESNKKRYEEIAELKRQKEELLKIGNKLSAAFFEEKEPTTRAEKAAAQAIAQSEAELAEFAALAAEEEDAMIRSPFRR